MWRFKFYTIMSILVFALLYLHTTLIVLFSIPCVLIRQKNCVRKVVHIWSVVSFWLTIKKVSVKGLEHVDKNKKYILVANHASLFDIMAIMKVFPGVSWFGRERLQKIPLFGSVLKMIDYIPMKSGNIKNTRQMITKLIQNSGTMTIAIFPEGTRTTQGPLNRFHKGFIYVLKASQHDVLPVTLNGFFSLKPKTRMTINFSSTLEMIIHDPIENKNLKDKSDIDIISQVKDVIESAYSYN